MKPLYIFGAGGHGKVVADILLSAGERIAGFIDDREGLEPVLGYKIVGGRDWLKRTASRRSVRVALGIGTNLARRSVTELLSASGCEIVTAVHPTSVVAKSARIGRGAVVMALSVVNADAEVGEGAIINTGSVIEHDCSVGAFAHVSPNAAMAGAASIGALSHLGMGAMILPGISVGAETTVGAGAVVCSAFGDRMVVIGVPARILRKT